MHLVQDRLCQLILLHTANFLRPQFVGAIVPDERIRGQCPILLQTIDTRTERIEQCNLLLPILLRAQQTHILRLHVQAV